MQENFGLFFRTLLIAPREKELSECIWYELSSATVVVEKALVRL